MDIKVPLLASILLVLTYTTHASDSLRISLMKQKGSILLIKVDCVDPDLYSLDSEQLRDGLFNLPEDCYLDLKAVSYHVTYQDSIPYLNANAHWFGFKKGQFKRRLQKRKILQLPVGYSYILYEGKYTLYLAYYSKQFGRCLKSNVIEFEIE